MKCTLEIETPPSLDIIVVYCYIVSRNQPAMTIFQGIQIEMISTLFGNFCFFLYAFSMKALKASDPNHSPNSGESIEGTPPDGADDGAATTFSGSFLLMALFILKSMYNPVYPPMMAMATKKT